MLAVERGQSLERTPECGRNEPHWLFGICDHALLRYAVYVRSSTFQRWCVVFLVLAKLLFGASVHAMPQELHANGRESTAATVDEQPCADHASGQSSSHDQHTSPADPEDVQPSERDCCKAGECRCPCAHASAFLAPAPAAPAEILGQSRAIRFVLPAAPHLLAALFRPPA